MRKNGDQEDDGRRRSALDIRLMVASSTVYCLAWVMSTLQTQRNNSPYWSVTVEDSNDNPPQFARPVFVSQLSTEAVRGQFVSRALAWDPDGGRLQYSVLPHALHHIFTVEPDTGTSHFYNVEKLSSANFLWKIPYCIIFIVDLPTSNNYTGWFLSINSIL